MIHWVCCSSKRAEMFIKKTYRTLERGKLTQRLYLCVPEAECNDYLKVLPAGSSVRVIPSPLRGLLYQRSHMRAMLPPCSQIVFIDDDVESIKTLTNNGEHLSHCEDIEALTTQLFRDMGPNAFLWGVYPVTNRMWMSTTKYCANAYIVGAFYGMINHAQLWEGDRDECEDYARQLSEQFEGRETIRYNWVGIQTSYYTNPGGMQQDRNVKKREDAIRHLVKMYPLIVKEHRKKDGTLDLRFLGKPVIADPLLSADQSTHEEDLVSTLLPRVPSCQEEQSPDRSHPRPPSPQGCRLK